MVVIVSLGMLLFLSWLSHDFGCKVGGHFQNDAPTFSVIDNIVVITIVMVVYCCIFNVIDFIIAVLSLFII